MILLISTNVHDLPNLARALDAADEAQQLVQESLAWLRMLHVAQLTRSAFPAAGVVVVDVEDRYVPPEGVQLAGVLDQSGVVLWSAPAPDTVSPAVSAISALSWSAWSNTVGELEIDLTAALGLQDPEQRWDEADALAPLLGRSGVFSAQLYRVELPPVSALDAFDHTVSSAAEYTRLLRLLVPVVTTFAVALGSGCPLPRRVCRRRSDPLPR